MIAADRRPAFALLHLVEVKFPLAGGVDEPRRPSPPRDEWPWLPGEIRHINQSQCFTHCDDPCPIHSGPEYGVVVLAPELAEPCECGEQRCDEDEHPDLYPVCFRMEGDGELRARPDAPDLDAKSTAPAVVPADGPDPGDVEALTELLNLMADFPSNEQRARYLLSSNWLRDRGAAAATQNAVSLAVLRDQLRRSR